MQRIGEIQPLPIPGQSLGNGGASSTSTPGSPRNALKPAAIAGGRNS